MIKKIPVVIGCSVLVGAIGVSLLSYAQAQTGGSTAQNVQPEPATTRPGVQPTFEGRGVAQGAVFTRGRNANASLTVNQGRFTFNLAEPPGTRARVRYQGAVVRQNKASTPNSFILDGRVQTFDSSASNRIFNNTTGTCRIEVFDARVISSTCRAASADSATQFLGLEQF